MAENVDISAEITALKRQKPATVADERIRATELCRLESILHKAARRAVDAGAAKHLTNGNGSKPVSRKQAGGLSDEVVPALAEGIVPFISDVIAEAVEPLKKEIAELKARPQMKYQGVWDAHKVYNVGNFVTEDGSLWHCEDANIGARPGSSQAWRLAVKRGRDGKSGR